MRLAFVLIALLSLCRPALADEFGRYEMPKPKEFARGVAAYDAGNFQQAYDIWLPLAHHGDLAAIFNIGLMLRDGRGIPKDQPRALIFFKKAAQWGHLGSEVDLADMYYKGEGTPQNYVEAARWLMIAARRGHLPSIYKLAGMFERGEGIEPDPKAARTLYLIAYEGGYQPAGERLSELAKEANEARAAAEPDASSTGNYDVAAIPAPPPDSAIPHERPADPPGLLPVFQLRGSIGAGGDALAASTNPISTLRSTYEAMTTLEQRIYGMGSSAKTEQALPPAPQPATAPACARRRGPFDGSSPTCRMPPLRF